jgi:hypothetical protein
MATRRCQNCHALLDGAAKNCPECSTHLDEDSVYESAEITEASPPTTPPQEHRSNLRGDPVLSCFFLAMSIGMAAAALYLYRDFADWEATGGTRRIHWLGALLYRIGGKWTIIGVGILLSGFLLYAAVGTYFRLSGFRPKAKGDARPQ